MTDRTADSDTERTADTPAPDSAADSRWPNADTLRLVPPVAALGTAFVLQVIAIADTVGGSLADRYADSPAWTWYLSAALLGVAVASCAEGGAAYLMDLYDKHLLARDSVWVLRLAMVGYVAVSAAAIHWWLDQRGLPTITSWLLAAMSASALFLYSRGSRWKHRRAMIAAGQLDPALPRLPMAAKLLHPVRWLVTLYLISWNPATTTAEARARYDRWRDERAGRVDALDGFVDEMVAAAEVETSALRRTVEAELSALRADADKAAAQTLADAETYAATVRQAAAAEVNEARRTAAGLSADAARIRAEAVRQREAAAVQADTPRPVRLVSSNPVRPPVRRTAGEVSVDDLADTLADRYPDSLPGRPTALSALRDAHGSCSTERAREAINRLSARRNGRTGAGTGEPDDDDAKERTA